MIPRRAGVIPKAAWSEATRMSQATASSRPPPKANPLSMPITGAGNDSTVRIMSSKGFEESSTCASPDPPAGIAVMSYPAQNASRPSPRRTTHRTSSAARLSNVFRSSPRIFRLSAFFFAGFESVTVATFPSLATMTFPPMVPPLPPSSGHSYLLYGKKNGRAIRRRGTLTTAKRAIIISKRYFIFAIILWKEDPRHGTGISERGEGQGREHGGAAPLREKGQGRAFRVLREAPRIRPVVPEGQRHRSLRRRALGDRAELRESLPHPRVEGKRCGCGRHAPQEPRRLDEARGHHPERDRPGVPEEGAGGEAGGRASRARARPDRGPSRPARPDEGSGGVLGEHPDPRVLLLPRPRAGGLNRLQDSECGCRPGCRLLDGARGRRIRIP